MAKYEYDLVVIGGGAAGLTASGMGATFGAKTMMIERARLGGDCTWYGCIPSKTLLKAAKVAHHIRQAHQYGLTDQPLDVDFKKVMAHLHRIRDEVYEEADRPEIYEDMGIEVVFAEAQFVDPHTLMLAGEDGARQVTSRYFVIAAGGRALVPPIEGVDDTPYLTNESLFELETFPEHLAIVGAGPIGTEMAQAFVRLGAQVTVVDMADRIMTHDDPELAGMLQEALEKEGVQYLLNASVERLEKHAGGVRLDVAQDDTKHTVTADAVLMATGRQPNLGGLGLGAAGIEYTKKGLTVDDRCRTNRSHIYAVGDVTGRYQFTHMSEHMAKVAVTNALLKLPMKIDTDHVPWATYTDPELAHVGATEQQLQEAGKSYHTYRFPYTKVDRALAESEPTGLIKIHAKRSTGTIYGVSVLGASAGELVSEYALAMKHGLSLRNIADTIHPYPSYGLAARRAADQWYVQKQSPTLVKVLQFVFGYRGPVLAFEEGKVL